MRTHRIIIVGILLLTVCFIALGVLLRAQSSTTVTGTIVDPNTNPYKNGTASAIKVVPTGQSPGPPTNVATDSTGLFTMSLPSPATYIFTICSMPVGLGPTANPTPTQVCFASGPVAVSGASIDVSSSLNPFAAILGPRFASGGATPAGNSGDVQINNGAGGLGAGTANDTTAAGYRFKGPNPYIDITTYGARALPFPAQTTTASCTLSSTSVTLASAIDFQNGDGIVLHQCGPAPVLPTPAAPSAVIPKDILNGTTTYSYKVFAEDYALGLTAASGATTITTGAPLGLTSVAVSTASISNGTVTVNTGSNHNFEIGATIRLQGVGCAPAIPNPTWCFDGVWKVATTPTATSFTIITSAGNRPDISATATGGTAKAAAHNWVRWTAQNNVMRYWICRQDGGAGPYNVVGVAQGMEPFYEDYGFGHLLLPPEVPSTCPSAAQNQAWATTISSGAGSTSITISSAAFATAASITAMHDNTVAYNAALIAAYNVSQGAVVFTPNASSKFFVMNFPLVFPIVTNNGTVLNKVVGPLLFNQPLVPNSFSYFEGFGPNNTGTPAFARNAYSVITGPSYPLVLVAGKNGITFSGMMLVGFSTAGQQWTVLVDGGVSIGGGGSGGSTSVDFHNSYLSAAAANFGTAPVVLRGGGFGHLFDNVVFNSAGATEFFYPPGLRITSSGITQLIGWPGIGVVQNSTFLGNAVQVDANSTYPATISAGGSPWIFENVFTESTCTPVYDFKNINVGNWHGWVFKGTNPADYTCGSTTPQMDMTVNVGLLEGLTVEDDVISASGVNIGAGARSVYLKHHNQNILYNFSAPRAVIGESNMSRGTAAGTGTKTAESVETTGGVRIVSPGTLFVQGVPVSNVSASVAAGGSVPVGTYQYHVTAVDINGGETQATAASAIVTTTGGNQTVNITWTAPAIPPTGYFIYRNGVSVPCAAVTTTSFSDTAAVPCGTSMPVDSGGGPVGMSLSNGIWTFLMQWAPTLFTNLGTPANGVQRYCSDCTIANPCAGGGTGAFAKRLNGVWVCN